MEKRVVFRSAWLPYLLVAPQLAITVVFFFWPAAQAVWYSFQLQDAFGLKSQFVGLANFAALFKDGNYLAPFRVTALFSVLVAFCGIAVSLVLAAMADRVVRGALAYKTLLIWPYAVAPAIAGVLWAFLFAPSIGIVTYVLKGMGVDWNWIIKGDQAMLLIVNTWLGFPYFMILCSGLIKTIPADLYEASALAGAKPLDNFFKITAPLILKPLTPLLISAFAFNFNNFVLIALLTDGRPDFLDTKLPAGTTDILVSYTYRIAFTDAGQNFGLAAAISTLIFIMVALMALLQLKATQQAQARS